MNRIFFKKNLFQRKMKVTAINNQCAKHEDYRISSSKKINQKNQINKNTLNIPRENHSESGEEKENLKLSQKKEGKTVNL